MEKGIGQSIQIPDEFICQRQCCIKYCGSEAIGYAQKGITANISTAVSQDQEQPQQSRCGTQGFFPGETLAQNQRRCQNHQYGGKIITQGGIGNGGLLISIEQKNPIAAQQEAGTNEF